MIKLDRSSKRKVEGQTILILVECLKGALKAGRFVLNHLYTDKDRVILLQVYKVQRQGLFLMRNISKILNDVSIDELTILKNKLIEEFNISPFRIQKMAIEGELAATLKRKFCKGDNPIVVIGEDTQFYQHEIPQKQISTIMKGTCIKNIFYIDNNITLIDNSRILNISDSPEEITEISKN
ncbi:MAG: hypothetical protein P1P88_18290, partial [Bacteroidales bacterium]|nr:hypothetical protein [Bacteroidales bacterium]